MDMIRVFLKFQQKDTSIYFKDKAIWDCGEKYRSHQGKYPVIFLTFKDVKFDSWGSTRNKIYALVQEEYERHQELLNSARLSMYEKGFYKKILDGDANEVELTASLEKLSKNVGNSLWDSSYHYH